MDCHAFESVTALIASPDIDVIVTVKVAYDRDVVTVALQHRKSVYCEWPLAVGLREALELAQLATDQRATGSCRNSGSRFAGVSIRARNAC